MSGVVVSVCIDVVPEKLVLAERIELSSTPLQMECLSV
jgi:hypothetical protein